MPSAKMAAGAAPSAICCLQTNKAATHVRCTLLVACRYGIYTGSPAAQEPDAASSILDWVAASLNSLPHEGPAPSDLSSLDTLSFDARAAWIVLR